MFKWTYSRSRNGRLCNSIPPRPPSPPRLPRRVPVQERRIEAAILQMSFGFRFPFISGSLLPRGNRGNFHIKPLSPRSAGVLTFLKPNNSMIIIPPGSKPPLSLFRGLRASYRPRRNPLCRAPTRETVRDDASVSVWVAVPPRWGPAPDARGPNINRFLY